jgi:hypothetical protein
MSDIRPDDQQGWLHLIEIYADDPRPMALKIASLAQFILESNRGKSKLAKEHLNYGGIKYRKELSDYAVPVKYEAHDGKDTYAKFEGDKAFIEGYWKFISRAPYKGFEKYADDSLGYLKHIKSKGYAESPNYVEKVSALFPEAEKLLKAAGAVVVEVPKEKPKVDSAPFSHEDHAYEEPEIVMVDVGISAHGSFKTKSGRPLGMVHHYTAGHLSPDSRQVTNMLKGLGKRGLGCMGMDEKGVIYVPKSLGFKKIGYHAGKSNWLGKSGLNSYLLGMEVCNPGKVYAHKGEFFAYWDVDSKRIPKSNAKPLDPKRVREWKASPGKQHKGYYFAFTEAQEKALINFDLWQKKTNPEFSFDYCVGHDEISLSGKTDPCACLSMPMADFRELLKRLAKKN